MGENEIISKFKYLSLISHSYLSLKISSHTFFDNLGCININFNDISMTDYKCVIIFHLHFKNLLVLLRNILFVNTETLKPI